MWEICVKDKKPVPCSQDLTWRILLWSLDLFVVIDLKIHTWDLKDLFMELDLFVETDLKKSRLFSWWIFSWGWTWTVSHGLCTNFKASRWWEFGIGIGIFIAHRVDIFYQYKKCKLSFSAIRCVFWPPARGGRIDWTLGGYSRAPPLVGTGPRILSGFQHFTYLLISRFSIDLKFT